MSSLLERFKRFNSGKTMAFMLAFLCLVFIVVSLKLAAPIIIPFFVAIVLAFVFDPFLVLFQKMRIPRAIGIALVIIIIGVIFWLLGLIIFNSAKSMLQLYPRYETRFMEIYEQIAKLFQLPFDHELSFSGNLLGQLGVRQRIQTLLLSLSERFLVFGRNMSMVLLFMVFIMAERAHFKDKLALAFEGKLSEKIKTIFQSIVDKTMRYLRIKVYMSILTGFLSWLLFIATGLDFAIVWAVLITAMNFIPTFGSIIAGLGVGVFALIQFWPAPWPIVIIGVGVLAINMIIGNLVEPQTQGDSLNLSPLVILVSLSSWGFIWGFMGLVLAVPLTVIIKIICENIPMLEPASILMGSWRSVRREEGKERAPMHAGKAPAALESSDSETDSIEEKE